MGKLRQITSGIRQFDARVVKPEPKRADPELLTADHRKFRSIVLKRAGYRCEWIDGEQRCIKSAARGDRMIADHKIERTDGGALFDPCNGQCLCVAHNTLKGVMARTERLAAPSG
jgi:hypothetical protein